MRIAHALLIMTLTVLLVFPLGFSASHCTRGLTTIETLSFTGASQVAAFGTVDNPQLDGFVTYAWYHGHDLYRPYPVVALGGRNLTNIRDSLGEYEVLKDQEGNYPSAIGILGGNNGLNGPAGMDPKQHVDQNLIPEYRQILDTIASLDIVPIVISLAPLDEQGRLAHQLPTLQLFNRALRAEALTRGLVFVDIYTPLADPTTGGWAKRSYTTDGIHLSPEGAQIAGETVANALRARYTPCPPPLPTDNNTYPGAVTLNGNHLFEEWHEGLPVGWIQGGDGISSVTRVASLEVAGYWMELIKTGTGVLQTAPGTVPPDAKMVFGIKGRYVLHSGDASTYIQVRDQTGAKLIDLALAHDFIGDTGVFGYFREKQVPLSATRLQIYITGGDESTLYVGQLVLGYIPA